VNWFGVQFANGQVVLCFHIQILGIILEQLVWNLEMAFVGHACP